MKLRKLKWKKDNAIKDPIFNCCSWYSYDKQSNIHFDIVYYVDDIVKDKFSLDLVAWIGDSDQNLFEEEKKTTKWKLEKFEKLELEPFKEYLLQQTKNKLANLYDLVNHIK